MWNINLVRPIFVKICAVLTCVLGKKMDFAITIKCIEGKYINLFSQWNIQIFKFAQWWLIRLQVAL